MHHFPMTHHAAVPVAPTTERSTPNSLVGWPKVSKAQQSENGTGQVPSEDGGFE